MTDFPTGRGTTSRTSFFIKTSTPHASHPSRLSFPQHPQSWTVQHQWCQIIVPYNSNVYEVSCSPWETFLGHHIFSHPGSAHADFLSRETSVEESIGLCGSAISWSTRSRSSSSLTIVLGASSSSSRTSSARCLLDLSMMPHNDQNWEELHSLLLSQSESPDSLWS